MITKREQVIAMMATELKRMGIPRVTAEGMAIELGEHPEEKTYQLVEWMKSKDTFTETEAILKMESIIGERLSL